MKSTAYDVCFAATREFSGQEMSAAAIRKVTREYAEKHNLVWTGQTSITDFANTGAAWRERNATHTFLEPCGNDLYLVLDKMTHRTMGRSRSGQSDAQAQAEIDKLRKEKQLAEKQLADLKAKQSGQVAPAQVAPAPAK